MFRSCSSLLCGPSSLPRASFSSSLLCRVLSSPLRRWRVTLFHADLAFLLIEESETMLGEVREAREEECKVNFQSLVRPANLECTEGGYRRDLLRTERLSLHRLKGRERQTRQPRGKAARGADNSKPRLSFPVAGNSVSCSKRREIVGQTYQPLPFFFWDPPKQQR